MSNKRPLEFYQEPWHKDWTQPQYTTSKTVKLATVPTGKKLRIDRVWYNNATGLAGDNTNTFSLVIKNGSTVVATVFNTDTNDVPAGAALAADTPVWGTLSSTSANCVLAAGDTLTAVFTLEGTQTLPLGELRIEGRYV